MAKVDTTGNTPLAYAARGGHVTIVRSLLSAGAVASTSSLQGDTPLHLAARRGSRACVAELLAAGANANERDGRHQTALLVACRHAHWDAARVLVEQGGVNDVNAQDAQYGRTALHWAARNGSVEVVASLLHARAELNARDRHWDTPFLSALRKRRLDVVALLLRAGCDVAATDRAHNTALHVAGADGLTEVVPLLLRAGLDVNLKGAGGRTPLMLACDGAHTHIVKLFLSRGAGVDLADRSHATALVHALLCPTGRDVRVTDVVRALICANCDLDQGVHLRRLLEQSEHPLLNQRHIDDRQYSPLEIAYLTGQTKVVAMLLRAGSDANKFRLAGRPVPYAEDVVGGRSAAGADHDSSLLVKLEIAKRQTRSLKELCRKEVLGALGTGVAAKVIRLPVSSELLEFLQFVDIDDEDVAQGTIAVDTTAMDETASVCSNRNGDDIITSRPTYKDRGYAWDDEPVHTSAAFQRSSWTRQTFAGSSSRGGAKQNVRRQPKYDADALSRATADAAIHARSLPRSSGAKTAWLASGRVATTGNNRTTPTGQAIGGRSGRITPTSDPASVFASRVVDNTRGPSTVDRFASLPSAKRVKARSRVLNMNDLCLGDMPGSPMLSPSTLPSPSPLLTPSPLTPPSPIPSPSPSTQSLYDEALSPVLQLIQATEKQPGAVRRPPISYRARRSSSTASLAATEVVSANSLRSWERSLRSSFGSPPSNLNLANRTSKPTRDSIRTESIRRPRNPAIDIRKTPVYSSGINMRKVPRSSQLSDPDMMDECRSPSPRLLTNSTHAQYRGHPVQTNDNERNVTLSSSYVTPDKTRTSNKNMPDLQKLNMHEHTVTPIKQSNGLTRRRYGNSISSTDDECFSPTDSLSDRSLLSSFTVTVRPKVMSPKPNHDALDNNRSVTQTIDTFHLSDDNRSRTDGKNNNSVGDEQRTVGQLTDQMSVDSSSSSISDIGRTKSRIPVPQKRTPTPVKFTRGRNGFASPLHNGDSSNGSPFSRTRSFRY